MVIKIVSFYTHEPYRQAALKLEASLGSDFYEIEEVKADSWKEAVCYKPRFILEKLERSGEIDGVLWTDADSLLKRKPVWTDLSGCDMAAVHWKRDTQSEEEILTGTMYWAKTRMGIDLCREWAFETPKYRHHFTPEQASLKEVLGREEWKEAKVARLPIEWCFISDDHRAQYPEADPIFEHYQLSRTERAARP